MMPYSSKSRPKSLKDHHHQEDSQLSTSNLMPDKPKQPTRPVVPYLRYSSIMWNTVRNSYPTLKFNEIGKIIGAQWRKMTEAEKEPYRQEYLRDRANFIERMKKYKESSEYLDYQAAMARYNEMSCQKKAGEISLSGSTGEDLSRNEMLVADDEESSAHADTSIFSPFYEKQCLPPTAHQPPPALMNHLASPSSIPAMTLPHELPSQIVTQTQGLSNAIIASTTNTTTTTTTTTTTSNCPQSITFDKSHINDLIDLGMDSVAKRFVQNHELMKNVLVVKKRTYPCFLSESSTDPIVDYAQKISRTIKLSNELNSRRPAKKHNDPTKHLVSGDSADCSNKINNEDLVCGPNGDDDQITSELKFCEMKGKKFIDPQFCSYDYNEKDVIYVVPAAKLDRQQQQQQRFR